MIGMPGQDRRRPVELFHQHCAGEEVRPRHRAHRQQKIGPTTLFVRVPVRGTEHEARLAHTLVAPATKNGGKLLRRQVPASFVQQDDAAGGQRIAEAPAGFGQFTQLDRPGQASFIARNEFGLGRSSDLAAGHDVEKHGLRSRAPGRGYLLVPEAPHPLEIVKAAHLGAKEVDDDVAGIDQDPVGSGKPLDAG